MIINVPTRTTEELTAIKATEVRLERNDLLSVTDWAAGSDIIMSAEMTAYRAALRDVPSQAGFPNTVIWPTKEATP